jgi:hypothetical protein
MKWIFLLAFGLGSVGSAADLSDVDRYLGAPDWAAASVPSEVIATFSECTSFGGCSSPMSVTFDVRLKSADVLQITTFNGKRATKRSDLERSRYEAAAGNWVRLNLAAVASYGYETQIVSVNEETFPVRSHGQNLVLPVLRVVAEARNQLGDVQNLTYLVSRDIKGYGAVLFFEQRTTKPMPLVRTTVVKEIRDSTFMTQDSPADSYLFDPFGG